MQAEPGPGQGEDTWETRQKERRTVSQDGSWMPSVGSGPSQGNPGVASR